MELDDKDRKRLLALAGELEQLYASPQSDHMRAYARVSRIAGEMQQISLQYMKRCAAEKQITLAELIEEVRSQGEDVSPELAKLIIESGNKS
jgi:predicted DNA-binding ribbon-helix-helix protein